MTGWDGIEEFVAVANAGSFSAGAAVRGASTTHMSRAIARLENRIQAQLFYRTTRTVRLTDAGRIFLDHCQRMILDRDEAVAHINERGEPQGELRVTCSIAMGERFIAPIVRDYAARHPKLSVTLELTNRLVDIVAEGFDLAVRTGNLVDSRLIGTRIGSRALHTCAAPAYLDSAGRPLKIVELADHACLVGTAATWQFRNQGRDVPFRPKGRWRCNSGAAVVDAALSGMGICQLPDFYVSSLLSAGRLERILDPFHPAAQPISAVYPERRHLLPKISMLVTTLRRELQTAMDSGGTGSSDKT